jgi:hypothetical protein
MRDINTDGGIMSKGIALQSHKAQDCHNVVCTYHMTVTDVNKSQPGIPK